MAVKSDNIASVIKQQIENFGTDMAVRDIGTVLSAGDGVVWLHGLSGVRLNEIVLFPGDIAGLALNLEEDRVGAVVLGDHTKIKEGDEVRGTGRVIQIPVGEAQLGRVLDPLGVPQDGRGPIKTDKVMPLEREAPGVTERHPVDTSMPFGLKAIDAIVPVGRGQRELVIGDRATGKTSICIDALINQSNTDIVGIYVAIGQKTAKVVENTRRLEKNGALGNTIIVAANASDSAASQFLAPYAGCAIAEYFMDRGKDVLIVYDDLSKHAWAYRQISLLLRRPPGREAYPGDVFYLHSRLLERAARLSDAKGGGSMTALPIIETLAGDVSAYIPTNVISITDGQIYLESDLFNSGIRPAVNIGISVTRVGSAAQTKAMKSVAGSLKLQLAQYQELAGFAQFGTSDLDDSTKRQLERGQRLQELLKQGENSPIPFEQQVTLFYIANQGALDDIEISKVGEFEKGWYDYITATIADTLKEIKESGALSDDAKAKIEETSKNYKSTFAG